MRVLVLVLAALAVSCDAYKNNLVLEEPISGVAQAEGGQLVGFLEKMKEWMKKGNEKPAIPVLDPLKKDHLELNINDNQIGITLVAELDNLRSTGLSDFVVKKGDFQLGGLHASIELAWKDIDLFTMYKIIKGKIPPQMALYGEGALIAILKNLEVAVDVNLSVNSDNNLYVRKIDLKAQLGEFDFNASGLLNDEELSKVLSKIVSELVPQILKDFPTEVSKKGGEILKKVLDQVLSKLTFGDLIDIIGS